MKWGRPHDDAEVRGGYRGDFKPSKIKWGLSTAAIAFKRGGMKAQMMGTNAEATGGTPTLRGIENWPARAVKFAPLCVHGGELLPIFLWDLAQNTTAFVTMTAKAAIAGRRRPGEGN